MTADSETPTAFRDVVAWPIEYGRDSQKLGILATAQVTGIVIGIGKALGDKEPAWLWLSFVGLATYLVMGGMIHTVNRVGRHYNIELSSEQ